MKYVKLFVIVILAWSLRELISIFIPYFSTEGIENEILKTVLDFAVSFAFLWLIFNAIPPIFSWLFPTYTRFEATRQVRRTQGLLLAAITFFVPLFVFSLLGGLIYINGDIDRLGIDVLDRMDEERTREYAMEFFRESPYLSLFFIFVLFFTESDGWPFALFFSIIFTGFLVGLKKPLYHIITPIIRFLEKGRFGRGGSGRFATLVEEWGYNWSNQDKGNTILLGKSLYNPSLWIGIEDNRHMLTVGGSRGGKGVAAIIPNLIHWRGSAVVIDPKGRNTDITAKARTNRGKVHIIDPAGDAFNYQNKEKDSINPFDYLKPDSPTIREDIEVLADALVIRSPNEEPHWSDKAVEIISGYIAHALTTEEKPHLGMVADYVYTVGEARERLLEDMYANTAADGLAAETAADIHDSGDSDEFRSILSSVKKNVKWLRTPALRDALKTSTFDLDDLKHYPRTLYIVAKPRYPRFNRLLINLLISRMQKPSIAKQRVLCVMDEFLSLGYMKEIATGIAVLAEYKLILWPIIQEMETMKKIYNDNISPFLTNSRAVQVFAAGDKTTKDFISEELGKRPVRNVLIGSSSLANVPYRSPDEVEKEINADDGLEYVLIKGRAPLLLQKIIYYKTRSLRRAADRDITHS